MRLAVALLGLQLIPAASVQAQVCYLRTTRECSSFWLSELRLGGHPGGLREDANRFVTSLHVGYMANRSETTAFGGGLLLGVNDIGPWAGVQARYRRWLGRRSSLNLGMGVAPLVGSGLTGPVVLGEVGLNAGDWLGLVLQLQSMREKDRFTGEVFDRRLAPSVSAQLGSLAGPGAAALLMAISFVAFSAGG